jgi:hypothetical protein
MLELLIAVARSRGLEAMIGHILSGNQPMLALCKSLGFGISDLPEDPMCKRATVVLSASRSTA